MTAHRSVSEREGPAGTEARRRLIVVAHKIGRGGGMESVHARFVTELASDWDIHVISAELDGELQPTVTWHQVHIPMRPIPLKFLTFFIAAGLRLARLRREDDVVHAVGAIVPNQCDVASVHFCHVGAIGGGGPESDDGARWVYRMNTRLNGWISRGAERWCYRPSRVTTLHSVSNSLAEELRSNFPRCPVAVVPNRPDVEALGRSERWSVTRAGAVAARPEAPGEFVVLFVGGDWARKGLAVVIDALALLSDSAGIELWVVGPGDADRYRRRAEEYGLGDRLRFFGHVDDVVPFYGTADVFVLPSRYETYSLAAHEAALSELPVVATSVHGVRDLVGNREAGILVDGSPQSLARAIEELRDDRTLRQQMGRRARERALELISNERNGGIASVLVSAANGRRGQQ